MAILWLGVYVFINLTSILWLGSLAINAVAGIDQSIALVAIAVFALAYQIYGGLKASAMTDIVQVALLVTGGLLIVFVAFMKISNGAGVIEGIDMVAAKFPDRFHLILSKDNPHYGDLPGVAVLFGGLWISAPPRPGSRWPPISN
jgi:SSS family solute:Na+ symporter